MSPLALTRRGFMRSGLAAAGLATTGLIHGCAQRPENMAPRHQAGTTPTTTPRFPDAFKRVDGPIHGSWFPAGITGSTDRIDLVTAESGDPSFGGRNAFLISQQGNNFTTVAEDNFPSQFFNGRRVGNLALANDGITGSLVRQEDNLLTRFIPAGARTFTNALATTQDGTTFVSTTDYDWSQYAANSGRVLALNSVLETVLESEDLATNPTGLAYIAHKNELLVLSSGEYNDTRIVLHILDATTLSPKKTITVSQFHIAQLHDTITLDESGQYAYIGTSDLSGMIYRVDLATGDIVELQTKNGFIAGLTYSAGLVYAANFDQRSLIATTPDFGRTIEIPLDFQPGPLTALVGGGVTLAGQDTVVNILPV